MRFIEILDLHTESVAKPAKRWCVGSGYCGHHLCCRRGECTNEDELGFAANWYVEQQDGQADEVMQMGVSRTCSLGSERQHAGPIGQARFLQLSLVGPDQRHEIWYKASDSVRLGSCQTQLRDRAGKGARKSRCGGDCVVTAEPALFVQPVYKPGDNGLGTDSAEWDETAHCQNRRGHSDSELGQCQPMPPECSAFLSGDAACELISRIEGCPDDQHLLGRRSAFQPGSRATDSAMIHGRDYGIRAHLEYLSVLGPEVSMAEANCAKWRRESVPIWLREKGL